MGLGSTLVLMVLGMLRELLGYGTLFRQADLLFGSWASHLTVTVLANYHGLLIAILPPGAFMGLAMLIAAKNALDRRAARRAVPARMEVSVPGSMGASV